MSYFIGQTLGIAGMVFGFTVYQQNNRKRLLYAKLITDALFVLHYILIAAFPGAAITFISCIRSMVFLNNGRKWANKYFWLPLFYLMIIAFSLLTWQNFFSAFAMLGSALSVYSFYQSKPKITRWLSLPTSALLLVYNISVFSVSGIISLVINITSSVIGILRFDKGSID